ncbi:metallophosphoesterase family protein [Truepera radiovictrix]|uniref:Metallophosphoesterase n=1 Tax=Truepera radiovictrix (strain DSM 17093 / CIP 108686 / LMG 22925 / RQ-24) TaxID=649638 RepID=D7CUM6_TRURR|nr:metallophosphoesterase family protein [Truepera radiovictrix]ADI14017.1 metallophosphoesterase [Truepera radiovictrix DSM 17093]WMT57423.1 metallophosphoesterase family protein [Truepera radiovictrix]
MRLGLISDVHANVLALEAVLRELKRRGAETILCLGDVVGYGPSPNETLELLRRERVMCLLGAADEQVAFAFARPRRPRAGVADETLEWTRSVIHPEHVAFLRQLPVQLRLQTPLGRLRACHGTLGQGERISLHQDAAALTRLLAAQRCQLLAVGNSHVPFYHALQAGWVINPGSVGLSLNGEPGADYALLSFSERGLEVVMDKVDYDVAAVAFDIVAWGLPKAVAEAVQRGKMTEKLPGRF